jgi:hypothetical protein
MPGKTAGHADYFSFQSDLSGNIPDIQCEYDQIRNQKLIIKGFIRASI